VMIKFSYPEGEESEDEVMPEEIEDMREDNIVSGEYFKKDAINDVAGMLQKLEETTLSIPGYSEVPWIQTLIINIDKIDVPKSSDDLIREKQFYDSARKGVLEGLAQLRVLTIPRDRPDDFFAEMIKTDIHMSKVKSTLLKEKRLITEAQQRTKRRLEAKYVKTEQTTAQEQRTKEKKDEIEALRKWRKLRRNSNGENNKEEEFPEDLLDPKSQLRKQLSSYGKKGSNNSGKKNHSKATGKAKKFGDANRRKKGLGGRSASLSTPRKSSGSKPSSSKFNRPGKRKRQQARASKNTKSKKSRK